MTTNLSYHYLVASFAGSPFLFFVTLIRGIRGTKKERKKERKKEVISACLAKSHDPSLTPALA